MATPALAPRQVGTDGGRAPPGVLPPADSRLRLPWACRLVGDWAIWSVVAGPHHPPAVAVAAEGMVSSACFRED